MPVFKGFYGANFTTGIFTGSSNTNIQTIVKEGDEIPGMTDTFLGIQSQAASDEHVYFIGFRSSGGEGIYQGNPSVVVKIADTNDLIPGTSESFNGFYFIPSPIKLSDGVKGLVFGAYNSSFNSALYRYVDGGLSVLVDENTPLPIPATATASPDTYSASGDNFVFRAFVNDDSSFSDVLFINAGNSIERLIGTGDQLDGKVVQAGLIGPNAIDGDQVVFTVAFTDNSQGIYVATLDIDNQKVTEHQVPIPLLASAIIAALFALTSINSGLRHT